MTHRPAISYLQAILAFAGACIAGISYVEKMRNGEVACVFHGYSGCAAIGNSSYSHIGPIELSLVGALAYIAILLLAIIKATSVTRAMIEKPVWIIAVLTTFGFLYSWYLQYVAHFILHGFCINCRLSAIDMTILFCLSILEITLARRGQPSGINAPVDCDPSI